MQETSRVPGVVTRLAWRMVRHHRWTFLATFVALAAGASIVMACGGLMETGVRANLPPRRLVTPIVVTGDTTERLPGARADDDPARMTERVPLPAELVTLVGAVDGVADAVADTSVAVALVAPDGDVLDADTIARSWATARLAPFRLVAGGAPSDPADVVPTTELARRLGVVVGDGLTVGIGGEAVQWRVVGIADGPAAAPGDDDLDLFVTDAAIADLTPRPGTVDNIAVVLDPGADVAAVRRAITEVVGDAGADASVLTGGDRGFAEQPEANEASVILIALSGVFGGMAVVVAVFVVAGTLALSIRQREREVALLRTVGMMPRQLRRMIMRETLTVSVLATVIGVVTGPWLGRSLLGSMVGAGLVPAGMDYRLGVVPQAAGVGAALLTAIAAAMLAARRAMRAKPVDALVGAALGDRWSTWPRILLGGTFLLGAGALMVVTVTVMHGPIAASTAAPAALCAAIGVGLLGPGITRVVVGLVAFPLRLVGGNVARLAGRNMQGRRVLVAAVVTPLTLSIGIAASSLYQQTTQATATREALTADLTADAVVTSAGGGLAPGVTDAVRALPEVGSLSGYVATTGFVVEPRDGSQSEEGRPVQGLSGDAGDVLDLDLTSGSLQDLVGRTVIVAEAQRSRLGVGIGDVITMRFGDRGTERLTVVGSYRPAGFLETMLVPTDLAAAHTTVGRPTQLLVSAAPGVGRGELLTALQEVVADRPGIEAGDRSALVAAYDQELRTQSWTNILTVAIIVAYTATSVINSSVVATLGRRREFAVQRLVGSTRGQVVRMVAIESALAIAAGVVLGGLVALASIVPFGLALDRGVVPSGPWQIGAGIVAGAAAVVFAATLIPTVALLRRPPAAAVTAA